VVRSVKNMMDHRLETDLKSSGEQANARCLGWSLDLVGARCSTEYFGSDRHISPKADLFVTFDAKFMARFMARFMAWSPPENARFGDPPAELLGWLS